MSYCHLTTFERGKIESYHKLGMYTLPILIHPGNGGRTKTVIFPKNRVISKHKFDDYIKDFDEHKEEIEEIKQLVKEQNELMRNMVKRHDQLLLKSLDQSQKIKQLEQQKNKSWWKFWS